MTVSRWLYLRPQRGSSASRYCLAKGLARVTESWKVAAEAEAEDEAEDQGEEDKEGECEEDKEDEEDEDEGGCECFVQSLQSRNSGG